MIRNVADAESCQQGAGHNEELHHYDKNEQ